jgi:LmbE family N-acetylglucosaminyl deacetylase
MTGHVDHIAVSRWTTLACRAAGPAGPRLLYATNTPEWVERMSSYMDPSTVMMDDEMELPVTPRELLAVDVVLDDELADLKDRALRCQASQVDTLLALVEAADFRDLNRYESFRAPTAADWP